VSEEQVKLLEKRTAQYVQLRDKIKAIKDENKEKLVPYEDALEELNTWHLNTTGAKHIATESGTIYRIIRISASLADADVFWKFVLENQAWSLIDRRANVTGVQEYATKEGKLPPGVNLNQYSEAGVRRGAK
jgi:hypothetical protein